MKDPSGFVPEEVRRGCFTAEVMSSYKLYYLNARGRAEVNRIIFAQADVKYEDIRFEGDQWKNEYKASKYSSICNMVLL